ncbi:hypothetical protein GMOD_00004947 [Pyrenophora seminiperda CCB06]|uniref:Uncharacterized protein n=1 Tax=Pyrenophora seminiperda CCB06 TaxID=1302712 RepID=A0A3M7MID4_9PLEO|nr:hypothetical protein GMOD_00004947 [Pyrenophora seminiperda CCB06]
MSISRNDDLDSLKQAMYWTENGKPYFHRDAYTFGRSLIPLLKTSFSESKDSLVDFLKSYETYRVSRTDVCLYAIRYYYIQKLLCDDPSRLGIFTNVKKVESLVKKQMEAYRKGVKAEEGWQDSMKEAGIWDDDKVKAE